MFKLMVLAKVSVPVDAGVSTGSCNTAAVATMLSYGATATVHEMSP